MTPRLFAPFLILLFTLASCGSHDKPTNGSENEIVERSIAYQNALNDHDVNALLDFWSEEAVYRNPLTGKLVQGREEIKKEYTELFNQIAGTKVEMERDTISFPFEDKAVEQGVFHIQMPGKAPVDHEYKIIYIKKKGQWKILNISEINFEESK